MTSLRRSGLPALLAATLLVGTLLLSGAVASPVSPIAPPGVAIVPGTPSVALATASGADGSRDIDVRATATTAGGSPAISDPGAADPTAASVANVTLQPSTAYEESLAHAGDRIAFQPGGRVSVAFTPRSTDRWSVGGGSPVALPAGLVSGAAMAASPQGSTWAGTGGARLVPGWQPPAAPSPVAPAPGAAPADAPVTPGGGITADATSVAWSAPSGADQAVATASATGLRRQVFGFLPYWQLAGAATSISYDTLSTIAYFSVGADAAGNLAKRNGDGSATTGWAGWTSSSMTSVINAAHAHGTRIVLTASVFAWTSTAAAVQRAILGSAGARLNLARQLAAAVRDRGADGVNLDFEPLVAGYETQFTAFVRTLRSQLNAIRAGYQVTFDTTGWVGNYPLAATIGAAAADAVFVMGYDYRTAASTTSGSIDPLSGPGYDLADTVRMYTAVVDPSRVILGIPWYGRAWSTVSPAPRAATQGGAKFGYSTAVNYANIPALVAKYGRRWDPVEQSPYIAYQRQSCTSAYGCVTSWRQVWYEDAASMALRYQLVNDYGLRGAGMWALGFDGAYPQLDRALADAFLVDHSAPQAGILVLPATVGDEGFTVSWAAADVSAVVSYDIQASTDGGAWTPWLTATKATSDVWLGRDGHAYAFRVRATDAKGNAGAWNVATSGPATAGLVTGGFGQVVRPGLAYRTGPSTSDPLLGTLAAGTIVALTSGPFTADGYVWFEATQPIREWSPVSFVERGVWIAVRSATSVFVSPVHAPNATTVDAGIAGLDFAPGGAVGAAAVGARTFSPNGDGARDTIGLRWTNGLAMASMALNVYRLDGSLAGTVPVGAAAAGARSWAWDGRVGGRVLPDGRYVLQVTGVAGSVTYRAPSANPVTPVQVAAYAVTIDTVPPAVASSGATASLVSPNGDRLHDTVTWSLTSPTAAAWTLRVTDAGGRTVRTAGGKGGAARFTWNGLADTGARVPDGPYTATLSGCDVAGNCAPRSFAVTVDTTAPLVVPTVTAAFSPDGDRSLDVARLAWTSTEPATGSAGIWRGTTLLRTWAFAGGVTGTYAWNGRTATGAAVADGRYVFRVDVRDAAGNRSIVTSSVVVDRTAGFLRWSGPFFPQDGDRLAPTSTVTYTLVRSATTTLGIYDAAGNLVRTAWTRKAQAAGKRAWTWDGRLADGTWAPQGTYTARLTTTSSLSTQTLAQAVLVAPFAAALSSTTVKAGATLVVSFSTVEPLSTRPAVTFAQPGRAAVTVTATPLASGSWRASFTVRAGATGAGSVSITARDSAGHVNTGVLAVAIAS